ncbi:hypothetical protein R1sor_005605 [Riccia sorocarpa]|uniref:Uncharacterized protein n=1 Tax=Riccia sorocarpa TaxID=122646 RepID=A0ABD3HRK8_9MARC
MTESNAPEQLLSTELPTVDKVKIFEDVGSVVIRLMHFTFRKARTLPCPLGTSISYFEDTLGPWVRPFVAGVEEETLRLLSLVDDKLNAATDVALKPLRPLVSVFVIPLQIVFSELDPEKLQAGLEKLRRRGIIGCTADAWVKYEPLIKDKSKGVYKLVRRLPGSSLPVYFFHDIGSPAVAAISQWLIDQSEKKDKLVTSTSEELPPSKSLPESTHRVHETTEDVADVQEHAEQHTKDIEEDYGKPPTDVVSPKQPTQIREHDHEHAKEHAQEDYRKQAPALETLSSSPEATADSAEEDTEGSASEISSPAPEHQKKVSFAADDGKAADLQIAPPQEEPEEHDEILDLFDTWGLGVQAISPKKLDNLRSLSVVDRNERTSSSKPKRKTTSFRL